MYGYGEEDCFKSSRWLYVMRKEAINRGVETDIDTGISIESDLFGICFSTEDQKEGMQAFLGKKRSGIQEKIKAWRLVR